MAPRSAQVDAFVLHRARLPRRRRSFTTGKRRGKIGEEPPDIPTIKKAVEKYLADAEARHLAAETVRKRRELLEGKLLPFCEAGGYDILKHLDVDVLRKFRASWPYAPLSARKRLEYLRSFFRFCQDSGWVDRNPAMAVKSSKVEQNPTLPFSDDEVERVLVAARALTGFGRYGPKIEPMVLLLRYSGLRIQDAACLERARLVERQAVPLSTEDRDAGVLSVATACGRAPDGRPERQRAVLLLRRHESAPEHGQELGSRLSEGVCDGEAGDHGRAPPSVPRHVRGLAACSKACRSRSCRSCSGTAPSE